jgi:muconolactone delta-isomerase
MEYLVNMTTQVPDRTSEETIAEVRSREATRTGELAAQGHILRLWRPPRAPGEWRTLGLFAATDRADLERILASMPLRVWRSDEITDLAHHPNDPVVSAQHPAPPAAGEPGVEFFTAFTEAIPGDTPAQVVDEARAGEARRTRELAEEGHLIRLWLLPAHPHGSGALGLWQAEDAVHIRAMLESLPLASWLTEEITPLVPHPSDPAVPGSRPAQAGRS